LGSTQLLADESGNVTDRYANTAFGKPVSTGAANPTANAFRFSAQVGYYLDPDTGEYYVRARSFSPLLARWLSEDPIEFSSGYSSPYCYAANNPIGIVDPSGLKDVVVVAQKIVDVTGAKLAGSNKNAIVVTVKEQQWKVCCDVDANGKVTIKSAILVQQMDQKTHMLADTVEVVTPRTTVPPNSGITTDAEALDFAKSGVFTSLPGWLFSPGNDARTQCLVAAGPNNFVPNKNWNSWKPGNPISPWQAPPSQMVAPPPPAPPAKPVGH
jgi:RHS repeat-associated protein